MPIGNKFSNEFFSLFTQYRINKCNELLNAMSLESLFTVRMLSLEAEPCGICLHRLHPWADPRFLTLVPCIFHNIKVQTQEQQGSPKISTYNLILVSCYLSRFLLSPFLFFPLWITSLCANSTMLFRRLKIYIYVYIYIYIYMFYKIF